MIFLNQGMLLLGSNHLVPHVYPLSRQALREEVQWANANYAYYDLFLDSISLFIARVAGLKRGRGKGRARAGIKGLFLGNCPNFCKVKILVKIKAENVILNRINNLVS